MSCQFCGKQFNRGFNLRRHEKEYCQLRNKDRDMSETDTDSQTTDSEDDASTTSSHRSESPMIVENESETEEEENDPWMPLVDEAMQKNQMAFEEMKTNLIDSGLDEQSARERAYSSILPKLQKKVESVYMERLLWMSQLKKDPVHKKIMQTKDAFVENDQFDPEEALEAAVEKRKFLIKRLLKNYSFNEENDNDD